MIKIEMFYIYDGYSHRTSEMIQHGLSVSLNNSPRSPSTPTTPTTPMAPATPGSPSLLLAPSRRRRSNKVPVCPLSRGWLTFADIVVDGGDGGGGGVDGGGDGVDGGGGGVDGSVSPLVQRRLEFPLFDASPISMSSFRTNSSFPRFDASAARQLSLENSVSVSASASSSPNHIGECSVCYRLLPLRSNHIFTLCGHLFCVRCVLKWWDTNMTCPLCRADLFEEEEEEEDVAAGGAAEEAVVEESSLRIEDPASDSDESVEDDAEIQERPIIRGFTPLFRQYLQWGRFFEETPPAPLWPQQEYGDGGGDGGGNGAEEDIATFDDTRYCIGEVYALSFDEKARLRENRQIALNLFGRLVFREMLLSMMVEFSGDVRYNGDSVIPKDQWSNLFYYQAPDYLDTVNITMYEIVIRRGCDINLDNEMNMFGFIKEIRIISTRRRNRRVSSDDDSDIDSDSDSDGRDREWENSHEYAFIADVFSPTNYYVQGDDGFHHMTPCGSYDMTEGTFSTVEIIIPFSNIRRLYSIRARERIDYSGIIG